MSEALELEPMEPITNDLEAEKALSVIREAERQVQIMADWYKSALAKIKEQQQAVIDSETERLRQYFETVPHKETKTQESYALPSGKLVLKQREPEWEHDDAELIRWAKDTGNGRFVKVAESLDWAGLKKHLAVLDDMAVDTRTGEVMPGIKVTQRDAVFTIGK